MNYTLEFLTNEGTIQEGIYGELKVETDKEKVWINKENIVTVESYVAGFGWAVDEKPYTSK